MMNQYYGQPYRFGGRGDRFDRRDDRAPYRRPMGRGSLPTNPYGGGSGARGGCGCGLTREQARGDDARSGCGCGINRVNREQAHGDREARGGCGCGVNREQAHGGRSSCPNHTPHDHRQALPVMENGGRGCGCGCGEASASCQKLMEQIRAVDFALYEVILYLDVYPHSCDALETYHKLKFQREALRKEYENTCGPLTAFENESGASWDWIASPFPWEYGAE